MIHPLKEKLGYGIDMVDTLAIPEVEEIKAMIKMYEEKYSGQCTKETLKLLVACQIFKAGRKDGIKWEKERQLADK